MENLKKMLPNDYELNSVDTKLIECTLKTQGNPHLIHGFVHKTVDETEAQLTMFFYNMFTTLIHLADSIFMHLSNNNMHRL